MDNIIVNRNYFAENESSPEILNRDSPTNTLTWTSIHAWYSTHTVSLLHKCITVSIKSLLHKNIWSGRREKATLIIFKAIVVDSCHCHPLVSVPVTHWSRPGAEGASWGNLAKWDTWMTGQQENKNTQASDHRFHSYGHRGRSSWKASSHQVSSLIPHL